MISSTMPSTKYSCSGSPLMFWNGSTAIDGLSGSGSAGAALIVRAGRRFARTDAIDPHRPRDVLDAAARPFVEGEVELVADLVMHDPARRRCRRARPALPAAPRY